MPFYPEPALDLVAALRPYLEIYSTGELLTHPPSGYLYNAVDVLSQLNTIEQKVLNGSYISEYAFQLDIQTLLVETKDGHTIWLGDLVGVFSWSRGAYSLTSVSPDGISVPQIYETRRYLFLQFVKVLTSIPGDVIAVSEDGTISAKDLSGASPVAKINGIDVVTWINADSNSDNSQDPDANWNHAFIGTQKLSTGYEGRFVTPTYYPGANTTITFVNGTHLSFRNLATTRQPLTNITSGADMYAYFCELPEGIDLGNNPSNTTATPNATMSASSSVTATATATATATESSTQIPDVTQLPYYPTPEVIDSSGLLSGYFLEGKGYEDVAVLAIAGFQPQSSPADRHFVDSFQQSLQDFLTLATSKGKQKLIIDVQGNGGGSIDLSIDSYAQLFPGASLNGKNNLRASYGMQRVTKAASNGVTLADQNVNMTIGELAQLQAVPFAYQSIITDNGTNFASYSDFYGPITIDGGNYSNFLQVNYSNNEASQLGFADITITGTNNRTGFKQPFCAENIVLLTDGYCASACTILAEYLKSGQAVRQIALGGRPQSGPMQAVGGVKGSQAFEVSNLESMVDDFYDPVLNQGEPNVTDSTWEAFSYLPIVRSSGGALVGVNGRNQYRLGDPTDTALQFVYEAADARLYFTPEMVVNPVAIWEKAAEISFAGTWQFNSPFVVQGSTMQPTCVTGGLKKGELGPQTPPAGAKAALGWLVNGNKIVQGTGLGVFH